MLVREARPSDAAGIAKVGVDTWRTTYRGIMADDHLDGLSYERSEARWRDRLAETECFTYVAEADDASIVGYAYGGPERDGDPLGELYAIYVLKEHQGSGIGRQLVNAVARRFVENGVGAMLIWVLSSNPSRAFYERLGGRHLRTKMIGIGGKDLEETAYGWDELSEF